MNSSTPVEPSKQALFMSNYLTILCLVERLHRLLLDVIKDEFERLDIFDINAVQGLLLFNIRENEVSAGELKSRGYYPGSNVSYNLKNGLILAICFTNAAGLIGGSPRRPDAKWSKYPRYHCAFICPPCARLDRRQCA